ncbi:histidinol-phosphatase HisJ family protein [Desulfoscipio gibsoniae]|uniref:Histidinol-phosphatase n=1 Tax=Desulfoscipio gibsoniae DSM 7213 TaxID=767817 RepID=R4KTR2_9FIRM|nr:histidinol-phosphatase HisJ family protein [Desulfoscipio gibsoniae]AGL02991.1 histidinol phosphate phosphatase HisJ family [Desulfoscipio gibsoniae DSM 7213]
MLLPDYHIHTARCGHATGEMWEYVEKALELGLPEMGFADHIPMYWLNDRDRDPGIAMTLESLAEYVAEVERLRVAYPGIPIRLGIEADYVPGFEMELQKILDRYPFDYVLGSVHYIDGWGFDNPAYLDQYKYINIDDLFSRYFGLVWQAARSGLFHVMAHPDLIKKFGYRPQGNLQEVYDKTARIFAEAGVGVEINTAGLRVPAKEIYPAIGLLQACRNYAVPVTTGSDAHEPGQVGYAFDSVRQLLREVGYADVVFRSGNKVNFWTF